MSLIAALLAPMFLSVNGGDIAFARMAAIETLNAYRARNHADLIAIAQVIGFGLAALGSLSLSMAGDLSLSITLRLRDNANALNRSAERNRRALGKSLKDAPPRQAAPEADPEPHAPESQDITENPFNDAEMIALLTAAVQKPAAAQTPAQAPSATPAPAAAATTTEMKAEKRHQAMWAIAMVKEAAELTASIPTLPLAERRAASIRAAVLGSTANELLTGASSPGPIPSGHSTI
jgi:hypothetical protein